MSERREKLDERERKEMRERGRRVSKKSPWLFFNLNYPDTEFLSFLLSLSLSEESKFERGTEREREQNRMRITDEDCADCTFLGPGKRRKENLKKEVTSSFLSFFLFLSLPVMKRKKNVREQDVTEKEGEKKKVRGKKERRILATIHPFVLLFQNTSERGIIE